MGRKTTESILGVKREVYNGASLGNTRLEQGNESRDRYIILGYGRSIVNEVWEWEVEASSLYFQVVEWSQKKLWNSW